MAIGYKLMGKRISCLCETTWVELPDEGWRVLKVAVICYKCRGDVGKALAELIQGAQDAQDLGY